MDRSNMLSAQKVKLHGMTSTKWTTKDKIIQYKGLINLYTRDINVIETELANTEKQQTSDVKNIQRDININRKVLSNACAGDKQKLRNTLGRHRELQMAYSKSHPLKVIDTINQVNFTKRKKRDMLQYRMKIKLDYLADLKLKYAMYEDRLKYEGASTMLPCEKQAQLITGRVQDAILKKEAAIYIKNSYKELIAIMRKDVIYFDAILVSLNHDGWLQAKCLINATKLGQIGAEYRDKVKEEFEIFNRIVKQDLVSRKKDLAFMQQNIGQFESNFKQLIRPESDINLGTIAMPTTASFTTLNKEIAAIEKTLKVLKDALFASSVEQIFPWFKEQSRQKKRLEAFAKKCEANKTELAIKAENAASLATEMQTTMVETTLVYAGKKKEIETNMEREKEKIENYDRSIINNRDLLAKVRIGLRHLQYLSALLSSREQPTGSIFSRIECVEPEFVESDAVKIIPELREKFAGLAADSEEYSDPISTNQYKTFEILLMNRYKPVQVTKALSEDDMMEDSSTDASVMSREAIKKRSADIVAEGLADLEYKPPPPKGKFKFNKKRM